MVRLGGEHLIEGSIELKLPFQFLKRTNLYRHTRPFWLGFLSDFSLALFVDAGIVQMVPRIFNDEGNIARDLVPNVSVGAGLRYKTGIGYISLDFAYRINAAIDRYPLQSPFKVHFSISQ